MAFVAACTATFAAEVVWQHSLNAGGSWQCTLFSMQAKYTPSIVLHFQLWRLLTSAFLHNGFLHLFWNCFSILMIGFTAEREMPRKEFLTLLGVGTLGANLASAVFKPYTIGVGASGTIFALMGVIAVWYWLNQERLGPNKYIFLAFFILIGIFTVMNVFSAASVDFYCHIGGFVTGAPLAILYLRPASSFDADRYVPHHAHAALPNC